MRLSVLIPRFVVAAIAAATVFHPGLQAKAQDGRRVVIEISGFQFTPAEPAISPGDVVVWRNLDIVPHTVTAKDDSWDSGQIPAGGDWETAITDEMIESYYCRFHPSMTAELAAEPE